MENNVVLKCSNLHKKFRNKKVIKDVSFEVCEGDILGFIGPNGAGKTTTIKMILGLQSIDSGSVIINGYNIESNFEDAIKSVGAIVENPDLYMYLTGRKNLELVANCYKNITKKDIDEVIHLVGLENRINDKVSKYSLGMRQRLGIAQALLHNPKILILDEPTNGLDPEGIKELRDLLKKLVKKDNKSVLISSHNLLELESFCNKVCIIKNGEIVETNKIKDIKKEVSSSIYLIEVDKKDKTKKLIDSNTEEYDEYLKFKADRENIPNIISNLVQNNIKIYTIKEFEISLEDAFLNKVGGNKID